MFSLSHDIKTPLSAIKLYSKALTSGIYSQPQKQQEVYESINQKADEIEKLVGQDHLKKSLRDLFKRCVVQMTKAGKLSGYIPRLPELGFVIMGPSGTGKTTFVKMWRQHLNNREFKTLYFNAWASDYTEDPLIALIAELSELSADNGTINKIATGAVRITASVLKSTLKGVLKKTTGIDADVISDAIDESIDDYNNKRIQAKTKWMPPSKFREASMMIS